MEARELEKYHALKHRDTHLSIYRPVTRGYVPYTTAYPHENFRMESVYRKRIQKMPDRHFP